MIAVGFVASFVGWLRDAAEDPRLGQMMVLADEGRRLEWTSCQRHPACELCERQPGRPRPRRAVAADGWRRALQDPRPPTDLSVLAERLAQLPAPPFGPLRSVHEVFAARGNAKREQFFRSRGVSPHQSSMAGFHYFMTRVTGAGAGCGIDFFDRTRARAISTIEALERLTFFQPVDEVPTVTTTLRRAGNAALDPAEMAFYSPDQYEQPGFVCRPFSANSKEQWVEAVDLLSGERKLILADAVRDGGAQPLIRSTSSGAACHSTLRHAVLSGLYELVERDAFMIAWLNRLTLPRVDAASWPDRLHIREDLDRLGFVLRLVDLTTDLEIPVLLAIVTDRHNRDMVHLTFASGPSIESIMHKLERELAQLLTIEMLQARHRSPSASSRDSFAVQTFDDHMAFYQHREKVPLLDFLATSTVRSGFAARPWFEAARGSDDELERLLARLRQHGQRVFAVDCTGPFLRRLGLCAARVVIPGLQPIHKGRAYRFLSNPRLYSAPRRMGLTTSDTSAHQLNPWPHPLW